MHIHHTALIVSDYARSKRFYTEILGLQILAEHYRAARAVADIPAKRAELQALGVACEPIRIDEYTGKQLFFIKDPDGLPLEFYQQ